MNSFVSFVVPVYNVEGYIDTCVSSIIHQTLNDWELILVNDGSTDSTATICARYAKTDSRINIIHQSNMGSAATRNNGFDAAKGDWIAFIDSDDWIEENYLETLHPYMDIKHDFIMYSYQEVQGFDKKHISDTKEEMLLNKDIFRLLVMDVIDTEKRVPLVSKKGSRITCKFMSVRFLS